MDRVRHDGKVGKGGKAKYTPLYSLDASEGEELEIALKPESAGVFDAEEGMVIDFDPNASEMMGSVTTPIWLSS